MFTDRSRNYFGIRFDKSMKWCYKWERKGTAKATEGIYRLKERAMCDIEKSKRLKTKILSCIYLFIASLLFSQGSTEKPGTQVTAPRENGRIAVSLNETIAHQQEEIRALKEEIAVRDAKLNRQKIKKRSYAIGFILLLFC